VQHGALFETWSHRPEGTLSSAALDRLLRTLPRSVLRLKGVVETDTMGWVELQYASGRGRLRPIDAGGFPEAALVAIGLAGHLPRADLDAGIAAAAWNPTPGRMREDAGQPDELTPDFTGGPE
jgi:hypothetical protein